MILRVLEAKYLPWCNHRWRYCCTIHLSLSTAEHFIFVSLVSLYKMLWGVESITAWIKLSISGACASPCALESGRRALCVCTGLRCVRYKVWVEKNLSYEDDPSVKQTHCLMKFFYTNFTTTGLRTFSTVRQFVRSCLVPALVELGAWISYSYKYLHTRLEH